MDDHQSGAAGFSIPSTWERGGLVMERPVGELGADVMGDPGIVWDEEIGNWRMFLFFSPPGHGHAVCTGKGDLGAACWRLEGPLEFTNPLAVHRGYTHKPYVVQEALRPNSAAKVDGKYWLLGVCVLADGRSKYVHRAWAEKLAGPWTWEERGLILPGDEQAWDGKHVDAVTGIYLADRGEFIHFYMGYPRVAQAGREQSPFGSAQGAAVQRVGEEGARKLGIILAPAEVRGHWAGGWVGGLQVVPGKRHRWVGLANASPTAPWPEKDRQVHREEPPPSLGGFAVCDEEYPMSGWRWMDEPLEWIERIPPAAAAAGEGVNLWRHHLLQLPGGRVAIFYNSGTYGKERLYVKYGVTGRI